MKSMYGFNWLNLFLKYNFITSRTTKLCDFKDIDAIEDKFFLVFHILKNETNQAKLSEKDCF